MGDTVLWIQLEVLFRNEYVFMLLSLSLLYTNKDKLKH